MKIQAIIAATVLAVMLTAAGAWGYNARQEREVHGAVVVLLKDTSDTLRMALKSTTSVLEDVLQREALATETRLQTLRSMDHAKAIPLGHAADAYLVSAREILRRHSSMHKARERLPASVQALTHHMRNDRGGAGWPEEAVRLKDVVDTDFREYRVAVDSYLALLRTFPATQAKLEPYVEPALLIDTATVETAKQTALDTFAAANHTTRQATNLDNYRPQPTVAAKHPVQAKTRQASHKSTVSRTQASAPKPRKQTTGAQNGSRSKSGTRNRSGQRNR
jgi:hypothetical protein